MHRCDSLIPSVLVLARDDIGSRVMMFEKFEKRFYECIVLWPPTFWFVGLSGIFAKGVYPQFLNGQKEID